ncbi:MAG TPA: 3-ketoacyl-ACP reductase [Armatimonadota bacterium]|nr:3-ketoacyl-ACP reductase [Armatimonadota bacterium]HOM83514.1 3-ketoacyl-ACP reductase [Armatimonadota bacterium]HOQ30456.1 3-ketoacyl-ACP reductase [Armatimonadota bacterium]HPO73361.1 3-ketoacyl-ACP reductase [Armatimonadota bacterium]HPT98572.1 3-ketoacyl-ACP reductase [Armatimonadota bacterium]
MSSEARPVALVTGASRGIGRGIALELARTGYDVLVNYASNAEAARAVQAEIAALGARAEIFGASIADSDARQALVDFTLDTFGRIDLLVNNAGIAPRQRRDLLEATEESYDEVMGTNLKGPYFLTQRVANEMIRLLRDKQIPRGRIVFVTSMSAYTSSPNRGEYCLSKAGLSMAVALYADRLAEFGIPVLEVRPGIIATDMTSVVKERYDRLIGEGLLPLRRWGQPEDIGRAVAAIARGDFDYSTGTVINVDGGFCLRRL